MPTPPNAATPEGPGALPDSAAAAPPELVTPLLRGVSVLTELTTAGGRLSASDLERATGLARSTVDRITSTLARTGYVRLDGRDAVLTPRLMELGNAYLSALRLPALLAGRADALADALDESVSLAVGDRDGVRFVHQATRRRTMSLSFRIGDLLPAERTAPGALFATDWTDEDWRNWHDRRATDPQDVSFPAIPPRQEQRQLLFPRADFELRTEEARNNGWALDDQLIEPGLVAVSVPVRNPATGEVACVASVVSHTSRHTAQNLRDSLLPALREAVEDMENELRAARAPEGAARAERTDGIEETAGIEGTEGTATERTPERTPERTADRAGLATWTGTSKQELGRDFIASLARGLTVLTAFGEGRSALTLSEVARATGLARATARRALITYEHLGLVAARHADRTFAPTPRVLSLGFPALSRSTLPGIAAPHLTRLAGRVHESASMATLTPAGDEIQYTAGASSGRIMSANVTVGSRRPAYATALGRVMLADTPNAEPASGSLPPLTSRTLTSPAALADALRETRELGWSLVDEELEAGLRAIAVPVRDRAGRVVAAVNVALHTASRTTEECVRDILPELRTTATDIESDLHAASHYTHVPLT